MGSWQDGLKDPADDLKLRVIAIFVLLVVSSNMVNNDDDDDRGVLSN
jgi:hypothetical protein